MEKPIEPASIERDPLEDKVVQLVTMARAYPEPLFRTFGEHYSIVRDSSLHSWNFYLGSAIIAGALVNLSGKIDKARFEKLTRVLVREARDWNPKAPEWIADCQKFAIQTMQATEGRQQPLKVEEALALWVIYQLLNRLPEGEEIELLPSIAIAVQKPFLNWWKI